MINNSEGCSCTIFGTVSKDGGPVGLLFGFDDFKEPLLILCIRSGCFRERVKVCVDAVVAKCPGWMTRIFGFFCGDGNADVSSMRDDVVNC